MISAAGLITMEYQYKTSLMATPYSIYIGSNLGKIICYNQERYQ